MIKPAPTQPIGTDLSWGSDGLKSTSSCIFAPWLFKRQSLTVSKPRLSMVLVNVLIIAANLGEEQRLFSQTGLLEEFPECYPRDNSTTSPTTSQIRASDPSLK
jgi:hypothetical protein